MVIKNVLFVLFAILSIVKALAIDQIGIAYRYNGKKQRTPLGGVYIKVATSPNGVVSQEKNGLFVLKLKDRALGDAMGDAIVQKSGMIVFNKEEVKRWHVQKDALVLIVCDADAFQKQKNNLIAIGRSQAEKKYKQKLEQLKAINAKQQLNIDQYYAKLDSIEKERNNALAHMEEYADMFARIDESEIDTLAQRAIELFNQGQLEESIKLFEKGNYLEKLDDALKVKAQGEELRQKADSAVTLANKDIDEYTKSIQAQVAAYKMKNEWDKAGELLKGLADKLQTLDAIWNYAVFAQNQNIFTEAEKYLNLYKKSVLCLSVSDPQRYKEKIATFHVALGTLYAKTNRHKESEYLIKKGREVFREIAKSNPQIYEPAFAACNIELASLLSRNQRFNESKDLYKSGLEIFKRLAETNSQEYEPFLLKCYIALASLYSITSQFLNEEQMAKSALKTYQKIETTIKSHDFDLDLASSYMLLAESYHKTQRFDESEKEYKLALEVIKSLADANPQAYEPYLAASYCTIADLYSDTQRFNEAELMYKAALEIRNRLAEVNPQAYEPDLAVSYDSFASLYHTTQRFNEAELMYKAALEIRNRLAEVNPQAYEPDLAASYHNLATLYSDTQRFNEAEQMYKAALEIRKLLANANPQAYEHELAMSYNNLANLYTDTQRFNEAERMHKAALEIRKRLSSANPQAYEHELAMSYNNLALLYSDTQHFNEAERMHKAALEINKRLAATNSQAYEPDLAMNYNNLAVLFYNTHRFDEAEQIYKVTLEIRKRLAATNSQAYEPYLAMSYNNIALLYNDTQRFNEAEQMYKAALEIYKGLANANPQLYNKEQAKCQFWLAVSRIEQKKYSEALSPFEKALDFYKKEAEQGASTDYYYDAISRLQQLYLLEKKYSQAYLCLKQNIPIIKMLYQSDKSNFAKLMNSVLVNLSFCSISEKQYAEAEAYSKEALEVDSTQHFAYGNLAAALLFQGKYQEAEKIYRQYKSELKEGFLSDFEEFAKVGVIPKNREEDVEKIKNILEEE